LLILTNWASRDLLLAIACGFLFHNFMLKVGETRRHNVYDMSDVKRARAFGLFVLNRFHFCFVILRRLLLMSLNLKRCNTDSSRTLRDEHKQLKLEILQRNCAVCRQHKCRYLFQNGAPWQQATPSDRCCLYQTTPRLLATNRHN